MPERQQNQPHIHAQKDLWGDQDSTSPAKSRRNKKGPPMIGGQTLHQAPLFTDPDVTRPVFPATPMKIDTGSPAPSDEGTLFSSPLPASAGETQPDLFSAAPAPTSVTGQAGEPRPALPRDPEVEIPEDVQPFVTHIPRYLQDEAHQKQSVMDFIKTRFFIVSYDHGQYRHHIGGIILESEDGGERRPLLYPNVPHTLDRAIDEVRRVAVAQGYLHASEQVRPQRPEKSQTKPEDVHIPEDLASDVTFLPLHAMTWEERQAVSLPPRQFYIATHEHEGSIVYVPGVVLKNDEATGDPHVYSFFNYIDPDVSFSYQALREVISNPLNHYTNASWKRLLKPLYDTAKIQ